MTIPNPYDEYRRHTLNEHEVIHQFSRHPTDQMQNDVMDVIRHQAETMGIYILRTVPDSPEAAEAIKKLNEVVWWANAGVARRRVQPG
jgi:hypothetical protein